MSKTAADLKAKKHRGEKITVLTCYDYPTARWQEAAGIDVIFVGDSVGTNVLGYDSEREVTMDDMIHHLRAVRRGVVDACLLADLPYGSCDTPDDALENARRLVSHGADAVKLEGPKPDAIHTLTEQGIEVWAHLGLNPQIHAKKAYHAKSADEAVELVRDAIELERAGAVCIVLETIPEEVGRAVTERLSIPTIGIGAGRYTDGQVLVVPDLLGVTDIDLHHVRKYADFHNQAIAALRGYARDVASGDFPAEDNVRHLAEDQRAAFEESCSQL